MAINRQDPIYISWNSDSNGNKVSVAITNEQHQITNAQFTLVQLPDYNNKVKFPNDNNMYEIDLSQQIKDSKQFKVDYNTGIVYVHSDLEASVVSVNYSGKGVIKYPATRIYDVLDNVPIDSAKSLQDYINKIKEYEFEDFDPTKVYKPNRIVYWNGSSYVCIQQTLNHEIPSNTLFWRTMTAGFNYRDNYNNETTYAPRDMVFYEPEQTIYLCVKASTGHLPTNTEYWVATVSVKGAATYATQQGDYAKGQGDYAKGQGDYTKNERESIVAEYAILKNDFLNATHVEMITVVNDEFVATQNNTTGFELALGTYNPLIDILQLAYKGVPLYEGDQYVLTGMTVSFLGFTLNTGEKIKIRIEKAVRDTPPIGADGSDIMNGSIGELKFAADVQLKLNRMVVIQDYTFTATEDNTTTFTVESNIFNPTTDVLDIYRENLKLTKDTNYSLVGQEVTLFEGLNTNEFVEYRVTKNTGNSLPLMPDGSLIQDGSVGELKLTEDARIKLNKSIIIESHTFTATSDNTTSFTIESTIFNPATDHVELTYEGETLKQDENYSLVGCEVTLGFPINIGQKIDYDVTKFVNQVNVSEGEYIIPDGTIAAIKLTQDVQEKINKVPTIEQKVQYITLTIESEQNSEIHTELQSKIDFIYSTGYKGTIKAKGNYVLDNEINVKDNVTLDFKEATLTTTKTGANMPLHYFVICGDNVSISVNFNMSLVNADNTGYGRAIGFSTSPKTTYNNITIENCNLQYPFYGIYASGVQLNNVKIRNNTIVGVRGDIFFPNITGYNMDISNNDFPIERNWSSPVASQSNIIVWAGFTQGVDQFTDTIYTTRYYNKLSIKNNKFYKINVRAIIANNIKNIDVVNNKVENTYGIDKTVLGGSDDVICLEFCRLFNISENTIENSGENGIDVLSCQNGTVSNNVITGVDNMGITLDKSDVFAEGYATALSNAYLLVKNVSIVGNISNAKESCIDIRLGKNISVIGNTFSVHGTGSNKHFTMMISFSASLFAKDSTYFNIENIKCDKNITDSTPAKLSFDGTTYYQYFNWGTIELGRSLAVESDWITVSTSTTNGWIHNLGKYKNVEFYFQVDATNCATYGLAVESVYKIGSYGLKVGFATTYDNSVWVTKGVYKTWDDINQIIYTTGSASIVDGAYRTSGVGSNLYNVTSGKIKIITY